MMEGKQAAEAPKSSRGRRKGPGTTVIRIPLSIANLTRRLAAGTLRGGDINAFLDIDQRTATTVPLVGSVAACGFPSPADDHLDRPLDFNELLVQNPAATFAVRVAGESMIGAGIFPGDVAVVDRSLTPTNGSIVLALVDGEFTLKRYRISGNSIILQAENPAFANMEISQEDGLEVWGVVKHSIRMF